MKIVASTGSKTKLRSAPKCSRSVARPIVGIFVMTACLLMLRTDVDAGNARVVRAALKATSVGDPTMGACTEGYAMNFLSNACTCLQFEGVVKGNLAGKGGTNVQITLDSGLPTSTPQGYQPFFASIDLVTDGR